MGAGCTKDAKGGVVDLQNGNGPETPRSPAKAVVKTEGRIENHFDCFLYGTWMSAISIDVAPQSTRRAWKKNLICFDEFKMNPISWEVLHDQRTEVLGKDPETAGCPFVNYSFPASSPQERAGCTLPILWVHDMPRSFLLLIFSSINVEKLIYFKVLPEWPCQVLWWTTRYQIAIPQKLVPCLPPPLLRS